MIRPVASNIHPAQSASMPLGWGRREPSIHGRQDKSADRGRAQVVGGIEVSGKLARCRAGALPTNINGFNGPSAVAHTIADGNRP